ncbi:MAG: LPS assembly protein LptD [Marinosulfonomonas sp.]|nr:LPS assembly protein LptD [Marinosulfonomonas sp.]
MGKLRFLLGCIAAMIALTSAAMSQVATLVADQVIVSNNSVITASGNIEVIYGTSRLKAQRITYDGSDGSLIIEGPIILSNDTKTVILASSAEMSADLRNGILRSARMVLDNQMQIAAAEIARVDDRYTQLYKTVASSCQICAHRRVPFWQIRAESIVHDQQERQLYFTNAQFLIGDTPVFFLPRLRLPDPTLARATGFLAPTFSNSTRLGSGFKIPYFIVMGDHADVTLTPYISSRTNTIQARFRRAFRTGKIKFDGALSSDDLSPNNRAYLFGEGKFKLPRDFILAFDVELTSDPSYLLDYDYSGKDRLDSELAVTRTRRDEYFSASLNSFRTLRGSELAIDDQLPNIQGEVVYEKRFFPISIGGQGSWELSIRGHGRESNLDQLGRDVARFGARLSWGRGQVFNNGIVGRIGGEITGEAYYIAQDSTFPEFASYMTPALEAELRWPMVRRQKNGATMTLEPVVHLAWTDNIGSNVPNEDSTLVEYDEGNLFALSRYPGNDRYERGFRGTAGLKWTRYDPDGWSFGLAVGRIVRAEDLGQFTRASGLDGSISDWLVSAQLKMDANLSVTSRAQFDNGFTFTKSETRLQWATDKLSMAANYSWIIPDVAENRPDQTSQLNFDGTYDLGSNWRARGDLRYDFEASKATRAGLGLRFQTDCVQFDLSLSRRFTSSTSVRPDTKVNLAVSLIGFGSGSRPARHKCNG